MKEKFNVIHSSARNKRHSLYRVEGGTPGFAQGAETGWSSRFRPCWGLHRKGKTGQAKQCATGLFASFPSLNTTGAFLSCLLPGSEIVKAEKYCLLGCTGQREEVGLFFG